MDVLQATDESKVLILNTGGTINMILGQRGYVPEPYFLTESLRTQNRFHDPLEDSLFSHSSSVEGYREWTSNSGRASPISKSGGSSTSGATQPNHQHHPTLLVRSTRPIGMSVTTNLAATAVNTTYPRPPLGTKLADDLYEAHLPSLITPRSTAPGGTQKRVRYAVLEWDPLLDSSNIEITDWIRIATEIELNYAGFDAFVILHGTDTMSYTSSALSFLLEDLGKTVIVTGAQIPLSQLRNDAVDNLLGALVLAGHYIIPECCLYFNHTLYRGNRVSKFSSYDLNAFASPNFPPLVNVGIDIIVNWHDVMRQTGLRRFRSHKQMSPHVATLRLFPGITAATVRAFLAPPTQGVVLETYGAGNAPQRSDLIGALKEACDRGVVIVSISQCAKGSVSDAYETGRSLLSAGVVSGGDMTPECALTKLGYLLSKPELSRSEVRALIGTPLRGELTRPVSTIPPAISEPKGIESNLENISGVLSQVVRLSSSQARGRRIVVSSAEDTGAESNLEAAAPWSWTAAEAASTEGALYPFLIHLAAARNDVEAIQFCLKAEAGLNADDATSPGAEFPSQTRRSIAIGGGLVNCVEPASGRSPLHSAALNGSTDAVNALLEAGALVHLRDSLGHTPLYYAARQGHEQVVEMLVKVGGLLSGSDVEGGFVGLAMQKARLAPDDRGLRVWTKAGADPQHTT
ncbi:asparaginase-domain-containing protein [Rhodofomes roseus]|uniref:asparaginase n=1 Tax=Rhodofomes roseus TaxID=34475 RepID=A0ABQ8K6W2_9APHY|nr:asparaginase-domain-containing protein [Rhodofomes roseus]KAH9832990.1 asparaginase-domain-containing protein [Rhodofomes roseus]